MSETQAFKGKLIPVAVGAVAVDKMVVEIEEGLPDSLKKMRPCYDSSLEFVDYELSDYHYHSESETLYKMEAEEFDATDFIEIKESNDGTIDFITGFYNGGINLRGMLDEGLNDFYLKH